MIGNWMATLPYHITQRGNNKQDVFFVDDDRKAYLEILNQQAEKYGLTLMGYCLMTNHIHLIAIPEKAESLSMAVGRPKKDIDEKQRKK